MGDLRPPSRHGIPLNPNDVRDVAAQAGVFEPQRASWTALALNKLVLHGMNSRCPKHESPSQPNSVQQYIYKQKLMYSFWLLFGAKYFQLVRVLGSKIVGHSGVGELVSE